MDISQIIHLAGDLNDPNSDTRFKTLLMALINQWLLVVYTSAMWFNQKRRQTFLEDHV